MKPSLFIAKHILKTKKSDYSGNVVRITVGTIALGVVVMLLSVFIITGFKHQIENKVSGFVGNIVLKGFDTNESYETSPIFLSDTLVQGIRDLPAVKAVNQYAVKATLLKTKENMEGAIFKGVGSDFACDCFFGEVVDGKMPRFNDSIINDSVAVSKIIADKLNLGVGDRLDGYFLRGETPRVRKFFVSAIYESGFGDYDKLYVFTDINIIRQLNGWEDNYVNGYEVFLHNLNDMEKTVRTISPQMPYYCNVLTMYEINPQVFDWLKLQDVNVAVLLVIMGIVCAMTIISVLMVIIIERTSMIGVLKAMGLNNSGLRKVFIAKTSYIVFCGILIGDILALALSMIQIRWRVFKLPQEAYYMSFVPVEVNPALFLAVDVGVYVICLLIMLGITGIISKISPIAAIRYE
ncbi:MAG: FtsX-like permease family protein [Bacteroidales bacterium]|nr:FtsX-like permease family protein [Bacteroidales bacterium]